jgi:hypothetical protein
LDEDPTLAIQELQAAIRGWTRLQMPYEAAQSRLRLGRVFHDVGNETAASMETDSANPALTRLGVGHTSQARQ